MTLNLAVATMAGQRLCRPCSVEGLIFPTEFLNIVGIRWRYTEFSALYRNGAWMSFDINKDNKFWDYWELTPSEEYDYVIQRAEDLAEYNKTIMEGING